MTAGDIICELWLKLPVMFCDLLVARYWVGAVSDNVKEAQHAGYNSSWHDSQCSYCCRMAHSREEVSLLRQTLWSVTVVTTAYIMCLLLLDQCTLQS